MFTANQNEAIHPNSILKMIDVTIIQNSSMEDVLAFKCCNLHDQNLEIHIRNTGKETITIPGYIELENETDTIRCNHLYPPWERCLSPGEMMAFYCHMDRKMWNQFQTMIILDADGNRYRFPIEDM